MLAAQRTVCALLFDLLSAGNNMLARIAMIAMTTSNSINVKPRRNLAFAFINPGDHRQSSSAAEKSTFNPTLLTRPSIFRLQHAFFLSSRVVLLLRASGAPRIIGWTCLRQRWLGSFWL